MAFTSFTYKGLYGSCSDVLPVRHFFSGRLGEPGDGVYYADRAENWQSDAVQRRVRGIWSDLCEGAGLPKALCFTRQVHGNTVRFPERGEAALPPLHTLPPQCDGLCTGEKGLPLAVFTADCVPVLLCDASGRAAAALHCGWKGTAKDMIGSGVAALGKLGVESGEICAAIGPAISACCFEVGFEVVEAMVALLGDDAAGTWWPEEGVADKYMVDLKEVNRRRLMQLGVKAENIDVSPDCTVCQRERYWSHRATRGVRGARGTQASIIML